MTTLTWGDSASDWDGGTDDGTVHESNSNTDHDDDTLLKRGYQISSPSPSSNLLAYYPMHEDSGSTCNDFSGNGNDGTISGATLNQTGVLGTTSYDFDGTDDEVDCGQPAGTLSDFSFAAWGFIPSSVSSKGTFCDILDTNDSAGNPHAFMMLESDSQIRFRFTDGNANTTQIHTDNTFGGDWYYVVCTRDTSVGDGPSGATIYVNATEQSTTTDKDQGTSTSIAFDNSTYKIGVGSGGDLTSHYYPDKIMENRFYTGVLSSSQVQTLYDVVDKPGIHNSSTKTS